ncbi:hypothetical protein J3459_017790 [Metarhizium acridum]|nr:hypothetical protein J3459_017790 [Metarhizium acridum]
MHITPNQILMGYNANNAGCDADFGAWVGVWPAEAEFTTNHKAWQFLKADKWAVSFNKSELGDGAWKAAFFCNDGRRAPFLVSDNFELSAKSATCLLRREMEGADWFTWQCDGYGSRCIDCGFSDKCQLCNECASQCGDTTQHS